MTLLAALMTLALCLAAVFGAGVLAWRGRTKAAIHGQGTCYPRALPGGKDQP